MGTAIARGEHMRRSGIAPFLASSVATARRKPTKQKRERWSARVTRESNALDLERAVFRKRTAKEIARSLKRSAEKSRRRKSEPFRSAMSMLNFYVNRAGRNLPAPRKKVLNAAKDELRKLYGRHPTVMKGRASKKTTKRSRKTV